MSEKLVDKIPDVFFDWYGRLIPGVFVVMLYYFECGSLPSKIRGTELFLLGAIAYIIGHFLQPLSSRIAVCLRKENLEVTYRKAIRQDRIKSTALVTKAHAEAVSMFSSALGALAVWVLCSLKDSSSAGCHLFVVAAIVAALGFERVDARDRKIRELLLISKPWTTRSAAALYQEFLDKNPAERAAMEVWESAPLVDDVEPKKP